MAHDVFISHSSQDKTVADAVCAALERDSIRCWIAPRDVQPGRSFAGEITRAIQRCKVMVLIFSGHSNTSEQVLREVQLAANAHLHIVQFRIEDVLPNDDLEYYLSTPHWLDAMTPPLETHLGRLGASIKALLELDHQETPPPRPVPPSPAQESVQGNVVIASSPAAPAESPRATPAPAVVPPVPPAGVERDEKSLLEKTRAVWIALAAIALFLLVVIVGFLTLLPRLRHPGAPNNAKVEALTTSPPNSAAPSTKENSAVAKATASSSMSAVDQGSKVGRAPTFVFLDLNRIFKEYRKTKDAETKINGAKGEAKKEYDERASVYKSKLDTINKMSGGSARDRAIAELKDMEKEINEFRRAREKELQDQAMKMREALVAEINSKINELNGAGDNFILDKSGMSLNGVAVLLFTPTKADMSDRVISALNDGASKGFASVHAIPTAVADMNEIWKQYHKTKTAEARINEARAEAKKEYDERADAYKSKLNALNKMRAGSSRDRAISELKNMEKEINEFRKEREKQLQDQALMMRNDIVKEIEQFISRHYLKDQECLVLDTSGLSMGGLAVVIYSHSVPDLTNEVISGLNNDGGTATAETSAAGHFVSSDSLRFGTIDVHRAYTALPEAKQIDAEISSANDKTKAEEKRRSALNRIAADVTAVGNNHGFQMIFNSAGRSLNGVPIVLASREIPDVTAEVIADLGGSEGK